MLIDSLRSLSNMGKYWESQSSQRILMAKNYEQQTIN